MVKKRHPKSGDSINIPLEELSLDEFKHLIDHDTFKEELPFDLISEHYPSLLKEWYPGYPSVLREANEFDPILVSGIIKRGKISIKGIKLSVNAGNWPDGEYNAWLRKYPDNSFDVHIIEKI